MINYISGRFQHESNQDAPGRHGIHYTILAVSVSFCNPATEHFNQRNMKLFFFAVLCVFAFVAYASAISAPQVEYDGPTYELKQIDDDVSNVKPRMADDYDDSVEDSELSRPRRVTCDVLSWQSRWFSFNHSACAVRCLAQRRRGGRCQNGVCVCRR